MVSLPWCNSSPQLWARKRNRPISNTWEHIRFEWIKMEMVEVCLTLSLSLHWSIGKGLASKAVSASMNMVNLPDLKLLIEVFYELSSSLREWHNDYLHHSEEVSILVT